MRLAVAVLLLLAAPAWAFASLPNDSPHAQITERAAGWAEWPDGGTDALIVAVHAPDYEQVDWEPRPDEPARYALAPEYVAAHHCDRQPPMEDAAAFAATRDWIAEQRAFVADATDAGDLVEALGAALHALQDCFSHSDFVDLDASEQDAFVAYLLGNGSAPAVRLAATAPGHDPPGMPDDPYPHDHFAKDAEGFNDEADEQVGNQSKFEAAKAAATRATAQLLNETLADMDPALREAIGDLEPRAPDGFPVPAAPILVGLLAAAWWARRMRPLAA